MSRNARARTGSHLYQPVTPAEDHDDTQHQSQRGRRPAGSPGRPVVASSTTAHLPPTSQPISRGVSPAARAPPPMVVVTPPPIERAPPGPPRSALPAVHPLPGPPPAGVRLAARTVRYVVAAVLLCLTLISFTVQTELASYVQHTRGWHKPYCMMYLTHSSWVLLWPAQLAVLRLFDLLGRLPRPAGGGRNHSRAYNAHKSTWSSFWRRHLRLLTLTSSMVENREGRKGRDEEEEAASLVRQPGWASTDRTSPLSWLRWLQSSHGPWPYLARMTTFLSLAMTAAGSSWYIAVSMTTPSDLTAIYNCSAFFAYVFSVWILNERARPGKTIAVLIAIAGVLVVAYGDTRPPSTQAESSASSGDVATQEHVLATRFLGNVLIGVGSVMYGLYEVLYKRFLCPPEGTAGVWQSFIFSNFAASLIGLFTLLVLWIPLPVLHVLGWETFELPTGSTLAMLLTSVAMNCIFAGSFFGLISLTSPVLSSVASLLSIFLVAIVDWFLSGQRLSPAAVMGGLCISLAFAMLSWSSWRDMAEDEKDEEARVRARRADDEMDYEHVDYYGNESWAQEEDDESEGSLAGGSDGGHRGRNAIKDNDR